MNAPPRADTRERAGQLCFVTSAWGATPRADLANVAHVPPLVAADAEIDRAPATFDALPADCIAA